MKLALIVLLFSTSSAFAAPRALSPQLKASLGSVVRSCIENGSIIQACAETLIVNDVGAAADGGGEQYSVTIVMQSSTYYADLIVGAGMDADENSLTVHNSKGVDLGRVSHVEDGLDGGVQALDALLN